MKILFSYEKNLDLHIMAGLFANLPRKYLDYTLLKFRCTKGTFRGFQLHV